MVRIGLIQMLCEKGASQKNLEKIAYYLEEAARRNLDMIGFPEMSLTGYADPTKYPEAVINLDSPEVHQLLKLTEQSSVTVLVGLIEANPLGKPFITQIVVRRGAVQGRYRKITIKDEETDWFSAGQDVPVFEANSLKFGIAICADIDNEAVFAECGRQGAKIVFELAAPGLYGAQATRDWEAGYTWWEGKCQENLSGYAKKYGFWVGVATQAGRTVDEDFPGGGYIFSPTGECMVAADDHLPGAIYAELDLEKNTITKL